jgi:hypothetical protein
MNSEQISFVIQGPVYRSLNGQSTDHLLNQIHKAFPRSEIIFSTWNEEINELLFVKYVKNTDPGEIAGEFLYLKNFKRLMISTFNGIQASTKDIVVKLRSDSLYRPELANRLSKLINGYNNKKILVAMHSKPMNPFMLDDKIQIGTRDMLIDFWNIDDLGTMIDCAHTKLQASIEKQVYPTRHMVLSPEQILFLRHTRVNISLIQTGYACNICYLYSMRKNFNFINGPYYGFGSVKWDYKDSVSLRLYLFMINKFNKKMMAFIIYIKNNIMAGIKMMKNEEKR